MEKGGAHRVMLGENWRVGEVGEEAEDGERERQREIEMARTGERGSKEVGREAEVGV